MKNLLLTFIFCAFHVGVFAQMTLSATTQAATCSANGTMDVTVSGGVAPYTIMLNGNPQSQNTTSTAHIQGLAPAVYQLWVKDANGQISATQNITVAGTYIEPSLTCSVTQCKIEAVVQNGIPPYSYALSSSSLNGPYGTPQNTGTFTNLPLTGKCYVRVTDGCGNFYSELVSLNLSPMYVSANCTPIDSVTYSTEIHANGGVYPYEYTLINNSGNVANGGNPLFAGLNGCTYEVEVKDACGNIKSFQGTACNHPELTLHCINNTNGSISFDASGGFGPYTYYLLLPSGTWLSNANGQFTNLPPMDYYMVKVQDNCGIYTPLSSFNGLRYSLDCTGDTTVGFDGTANLEIYANPQLFPINIICNTCAYPDTFTATYPGSYTDVFNTLTSSYQSYTAIDNCGGIKFLDTNCELKANAEMIWLTPVGGQGNGNPCTGSGQNNIICGNTLKITCSLPGVTYNLYEHPSGNFYASNTTGLFPYIPLTTYLIDYVNSLGYVIKKDTFNTRFYITDISSNCNSIMVGACPYHVSFSLYQGSQLLVQGNSSGIFDNLTSDMGYKVVAYDSTTGQTISRNIYLHGIGDLSINVPNCNQIEAKLILPPGVGSDSTIVFTLSDVNGVVQQQPNGLFSNVQTGVPYTVTVSRQSCISKSSDVFIPTPDTLIYCLTPEISAGTFRWGLYLQNNPLILCGIYDSLQTLVKDSATVFTGLLPQSTYSLHPNVCAQSATFTLPPPPDTTLQINITSICLNLACIEASGGMMNSDWDTYLQSYGFNKCMQYVSDVYRLSRGNTIITENTTGEFCDLEVGGIYTIALYRGGQLAASQDVFIPSYLQPNLFAYTGVICAGNPYGEILATVTGTGFPFTFTLLNPPAGYPTPSVTVNAATASFPQLPIGIYDFMVYDNCGASADFSSSVVTMGFTPTAIPNCNGSVTITVPYYPDWTYIWYDDTGDTIGTSATIVLTPTSTSIVSVDIFTNAGCNYSTNVSVSPFSGSGNSLANAGADQNIQLSYASLSVTTTLIGNPPPPNTNVTWEVISNNSQYVNIATPFSSQTSVTFLDTGSYLFVYKIIHNSCISADTVAVTVTDCRVQVRLSAEVITTPATCDKYTNDGNASVIVTKGAGPFSYSWSNGAQTNRIEHIGAGKYWVKVTDQSQCFAGEPPFYSEFEVGYVKPSPIADFSSDPSNQSYIYLGNANFSFTNTSQYATHYLWNFGKNDTSTATHPYITILDTGILWVKLSAFNEECKGVVVKRYEIVPNGTIYIANVFSPNGDTRNDVFAPVGEDIISLYFAIYDRAGKKIFESRSTDNAWDGKINGQDAPEGVYTFWLEATMKGNRSIKRPGTVTLIR